MSYLSLHNSRERMELSVMALLIGMFLLVMALMFIHPTLALAVFGLGLVTALLAGGVDKLFGRAERQAARKSLAGHTCPRCGAPVHWDGCAEAHWHCAACRADFMPDGLEEAPRRQEHASGLPPSRPPLDEQLHRRSWIQLGRPPIHRRPRR